MLQQQQGGGAQEQHFRAGDADPQDGPGEARALHGQHSGCSGKNVID